MFLFVVSTAHAPSSSLCIGTSLPICNDAIPPTTISASVGSVLHDRNLAFRPIIYIFSSPEFNHVVLTDMKQAIRYCSIKNRMF